MDPVICIIVLENSECKGVCVGKVEQEAFRYQVPSILGSLSIKREKRQRSDSVL